MFYECVIFTNIYLRERERDWRKGVEASRENGIISTMIDLQRNYIHHSTTKHTHTKQEKKMKKTYGFLVGLLVGNFVGFLVGSNVGLYDGTSVGFFVVGFIVGTWVGCFVVGSNVVVGGLVVGLGVGRGDGGDGGEGCNVGVSVISLVPPPTPEVGAGVVVVVGTTITGGNALATDGDIVKVVAEGGLFGSLEFKSVGGEELVTGKCVTHDHCSKSHAQMEYC